MGVSGLQSLPNDATTWREDETDVDEAVLVAAARLDPRSFAPLYHRYVTPVYRYCYLRLGNQQAAEDATSEVFTKALAALPGLRDGPFAGWLFRIAHNVVVDVYRRHRPTVPVESAWDVADGRADVEAAAIARSEAARLQAALARLSHDQRVTVELDLAGWSGQQIAAALGKSLGTVRVLRFRALRRLPKILATLESGGVEGNR